MQKESPRKSAHVKVCARLESNLQKTKWKMAEGERQSIFSDRGLRNYKPSPLLNAVKKNQASERSSLSGSFEAPKSYGTTRNPLLPQCDVKFIGHVLETTDTLQGLAIKYGVTVSKRV